MKNKETWRPTKFVYRKGKLTASRDTKEVHVASRVIADLIARFYSIALKEHASGRLIDLGCGKAPLYHVYRDCVSESVCVDWQNTLHKNEHLDFECDLTSRLPFRDGEFDTIVLSDVLEHIPNPEDLWREMSRILAPSGKIILNVPFFHHIHELPHDYYRYTEFALQRFVTNSGLRIIQLESIGGTPEILGDILSKHLKVIPFMGGGLAALTQWMTWQFVHMFPGKKLSMATRRIFPLGYCLIARKD